MNIRHCVAALLGAVLLGCFPTARADDGPGGTAAAAPAAVMPCDLAAWIEANAPAGLVVRAGPGAEHPAVAAVPKPYSDGEDTYFPEVAITGARDGWFRIARVVTDLYGGLPTDPVTAFAGEGWLPGDVLRLHVEGSELRSRPSRDAPVTFALSGTGGDTDLFKVTALHACTGPWVEVEGRQGGRRGRGWTDDICASQVTTCP